jgi:hypothetical protein
VSQALTSWAVIRIWDSLRSPMNADPPSAAGEVGVPGAGELSESRMEALDGIDPAWCPAWGIDWQRGFHPTHAHVRAGGALPVRAGEVIVQGEDLGAWTIAQRAGWRR